MEGTKCNGWAEISLQECKRHCDNNETPIECPKKINTCKYIMYYTGNVSGLPRRCFLADESCKPVDAESNRGTEFYQKKREFMIISLTCAHLSFTFAIN